MNISARQILEFFSPRWFIFLMGTGALANAFNMTGNSIIAETLLLISLLSFPVALFFIVMRGIVYPASVKKEWQHSSLIQFYSAISIAAAVIATGLLNIKLSLIGGETAYNIAYMLWWFALATGVFFVIFTPFQVIYNSHAEPKRLLGFWFLPPVGIFVLVFAGNFLAMKSGKPLFAENVLYLNTFLLGVAVFLSIILFTMILFRAIAFKRPKADVAPSFMIAMAPIGVSIIALNTYGSLLAKVAPEGFVSAEYIVPSIQFVSALLWGFGIWYLAVALLITGRYFLTEKVPVTLGYWALIFPPSAYTITTFVLAKALHIPALADVATVFTVTLGLAWAVIFALTVRGMINRSIFALPPSFSEASQAQEEQAYINDNVQQRYVANNV